MQIRDVLYWISGKGVFNFIDQRSLPVRILIFADQVIFDFAGLVVFILWILLRIQTRFRNVSYVFSFNRGIFNTSRTIVELPQSAPLLPKDLSYWVSSAMSAFEEGSLLTQKGRLSLEGLICYVLNQILRIILNLTLRLHKFFSKFFFSEHIDPLLLYFLCFFLLLYANYYVLKKNFGFILSVVLLTFFLWLCNIITFFQIEKSAIVVSKILDEYLFFLSEPVGLTVSN